MANINQGKFLPSQSIKKSIPKSSSIVSTKYFDNKSEDSSSVKKVFVIKKKVAQIADILKSKYLLNKKSEKTKKIESEKEKRKRREDDLEKKKQKSKSSGEGLLGSVPGTSITDSILRFAGFTFLGFLVNNFSSLLPGLIDLAEKLKPAAAALDYFARGFVDNSIKFIEAGYAAYDSLRSITKSIGGDGAAKIFDDFSGNLQKFLNYTLLLAYIFKPRLPGKDPKRRPPGGGPGSGFLAGVATGFAACKAGKVLPRSSSAAMSAVRNLTLKKSSARLSSRGSTLGFNAEIARINQRSTERSIQAYMSQGFSRKEAAKRVAELAESQRTTSSRGGLALLEKGAQTGGRSAQSRYFDAASDASRAGANVPGTGSSGRTGAQILDDLVGKPPSQTRPRIRDPRSPYLNNVKPSVGKLGKFARLSTLPVVGGFIDFIFKLFSGEKVSRAAVTSAAAAAGGVAGSIAGTALTASAAFFSGGFGAALAPFLVGGLSLAGAALLETIAGPAAYDFADKRFNFAYASGGIVNPSRAIAVGGESKKQTINPQILQVGRDVGGIKVIESVYGSIGYGRSSPLRLLQETSNQMKMIGGFVGSLISGTIDLLLGQKYDIGLLKYIGGMYGGGTRDALENAANRILELLKKESSTRGDDPGAQEDIGKGTPPGTISSRPRVIPDDISGELTSTGYFDSQGRPIRLKGAAAAAFIRMAEAAKKEGVDIGPGISNAFRTPEHNERVGGSSVSRHLKGLAFDINWYSKAGIWIQNNAHKYDFKYNTYSDQSTHFDYAPKKSAPIVKPSSGQDVPKTEDGVEKVSYVVPNKPKSVDVAMMTTYNENNNYVLMYQEHRIREVSYVA